MTEQDTKIVAWVRSGRVYCQNPYGPRAEQDKTATYTLAEFARLVNAGALPNMCVACGDMVLYQRQLDDIAMQERGAIAAFDAWRMSDAEHPVDVTWEQMPGEAKTYFRQLAINVLAVQYPGKTSNIPVLVDGIRLFRDGGEHGDLDYVIMEVQIAGKWYMVIRELAANNFDHTVEPDGVRQLIDEYNARTS